MNFCYIPLIFLCNATLDYYDQHARRYEKECYAINIEKTYSHFLPHLKPGDVILDAGCGPGRDITYFLDKGFKVIAFDGSKPMVDLAKKNTSLDVLHLNLLNFAIDESYNAIWASCSLLHVPKDKMISVINNLCTKLIPGGVFYFSFKLGDSEVTRNSRNYSDYNSKQIQNLIEQIPNLSIIDQWISDDLSNSKLAKIIHTIAKKIA